MNYLQTNLLSIPPYLSKELDLSIPSICIHYSICLLFHSDYEQFQSSTHSFICWETHNHVLNLKSKRFFIFRPTTTWFTFCLRPIKSIV